MSVLIKGINVKEIKRGAVACLNIDDVVFFVTSDKIIHVPDHGDLIDRDAALRVVCSACYDTKAESRIGCDVTCYEFDAMMDLPIVIPAERNEEC